MLRQRNCYFALGLFGYVILLSTTTADNSVHILSKYAHQSVTSTTLKWLPVAHYNPNESKEEIVIGGFENISDGEGATLLSQCVVHVSPAVQCHIAISVKTNEDVTFTFVELDELN